MMLYRNVLNFLRGSVQVEIECACPERVLNLCAVEEIAFWDLQWLSPIALRLRVTRRGWHALREVCTRADAQASRLRERGAPQLLLRLRTRYALLAALALFALLLFGGNLFIWSFEVTGNETVPTETILRALEKCGVAVADFREQAEKAADGRVAQALVAEHIAAARDAQVLRPRRDFARSVHDGEIRPHVLNLRAADPCFQHQLHRAAARGVKDPLPAGKGRGHGLHERAHLRREEIVEHARGEEHRAAARVDLTEP